MKSPFKFLSAYSAADVDHFFGRQEEVETLYTMVFKTNLLLIYGLSGTGKTSIVQCGLAARFDDSEWYPFTIRRQSNINESIEKSLDEALGDHDSDSIVDKIELINEEYYRPVYLIFDQFEELFILGDKNEQLKCIGTIKSILDANLQCKIILIMREEYIGRLYPYEPTVPLLFKHRFRVETMGPIKIKEVIERSFSTFNIQVEEPQDKSIQLIMDNLSGANNEIALPYLQVYLDILYREEYRRTIGDKGSTEQYPLLPVTREEIDDIGQIDDVLDKFLDQQQGEIFKLVKSNHPEIDSATIPKILDVFVTDDGTKRPIQIKREDETFTIEKSDAYRMPDVESALIQEIVEAFEKSRVLRVQDNSIELAHDSLAALLDKRRSEEQRILNQIRRRILNVFQEYENSGTFLNQRQLDTFLHLIPQLNLSDDLLDFIEKSREDAERKANEELERQKQELEVQQQKKEAKLVKEKLIIEKKAKKRLIIGMVLIGLMLPIMAYLAWSANENKKIVEEQAAVVKQNNIVIRAEKSRVDSLLLVSEEEKKAMGKLLNELENVQQLLDTLESIGINNEALQGLLTEASSSIAEVKEDKKIKEVNAETTKVINAYMHRRGSDSPKSSFNKGDVLGVKMFLYLPQSTEQISWEWRDPNGKVLKAKQTKAMGRNTSERGGRLFDFKGIHTSGKGFSVVIFNGNNEVIKKVSFDVN